MNLGSLIHASDNIIASVLYLLICFVTTMWLLVIYHSKTRTKTVRGTFFNIILYTIILLLVSNFLIVVFLNAGIDGWLFRVVYAIHWGSFIWWFGTYRNYNLLFLSGDGEVDWSRTSMKDLFTKFSISKRLLWNTVFQVLALVIYFFLPFKMLDVNNLNFIDGIGVYFVIAYMFIVGGISLYETVFVYKDESLFNKLSVVFVFLVMLVAIACQYIVKDTIVYCISAAIQVFFLYFMVENPDIKLRKDIEKMKIGIEKSNKAKTDFLSNMSHEIRTPMNAIVGFSDSLLNNKNFDVKTARADIENIYTAGNNLVDIINNILDISKIESEQGTLSNKNCSIDKIVKELASVVKARLGKKPVEFITELDEHIPSVIWGDSTKIYQVLLNIANNSVKYTEVGKIKLSCIPETLDNKQSLLHFKISDTGYGIKKEDFDKVFKQYSRLDDATSNDIEGTGLGLVITKQFVELMGGKIWFTSDFEVGTTFYIDIPVKVIDDTPIGVQKDISTDKTEDGYIRHLDCSDYTVLIVDDNETNLKVASVLLEKYNFKIETAKNGKDCIYKFKYGNHYDMILLDDMMPEMDGVSTVKIIKKLDVFDIPPIVAFTANAMTGMGEKYLDAGFDYYLPMPVSVQELDELVKTYFGEKVKTYVEDREGFIAEEKENIKSTKDDHIEDNNDNVKEEVREEKPVEESHDEKSEKEEETSEEKTNDDSKEEVREEKPVEESHDEKSEKVEETSEEKPNDDSKEEVKEENPVEESHDEKSEKVEETSEENTNDEVKEEVKEEKPVEESQDEKSEKVEETSEENTNDEVKEEVKEEKPVETSHDEKSGKVEESSEENTSNSEESSKDEGNKEETSEEKTSDEEVKEEVDENSSGDVTADQEKFLRDKGIDMDKALEFLMDMEMYNLTICDFLAAVDEKWDRIKKYKDDEDMSNYAVEVHSLKSDCKYLGFMKLADVSYEHELKSKEDNLEFVKENFDRLEKEYNDALAIMKEYVQKYNIKGE